MNDDVKKKLAKVRQLIGMTGSSSEEEARSMALIACRMILKNKFEIVDVAKPERRYEAPFDPFDPKNNPFRNIHVERDRGHTPGHAPRSASQHEQDLRDFFNDIWAREGRSNPHPSPQPKPPDPSYSAGYDRGGDVRSSVPRDPKPSKSCFVLHPDIVENAWVLRHSEWTLRVECDGCSATIAPNELAWHSRFELRCQKCSQGTVGEAFRQK